MNGQSDKTRTISITLPESEIEELKDLSLALDASASHILHTCFFLMKSTLKNVPTLIKAYENHKVFQHYLDTSRTANNAGNR